MSPEISKRSTRVAIVVLAAAMVVSLGVLAQDEGRVLHEYFNPWNLGEGLDASGADGSEGAARGGPGNEPPTQRSSGAGAPPPLSVNPSDDEVVFGADGPVDPGATSQPYGPLNPGQQETTLDDETDRVDRLSYYANFEPSIMPYKRGVVQNAVRVADGEYKVRLSSSRDRSVRIGGTENAQMETFWGTFALRTQSGRKHPLPSVAAEQTILEVQSEPDVAVDIRRDEADNYYLETQHEGLLRLNIKMGAPRFYFDGRPRTDVEWSDFEEGRTPAIPSEARDAAERVLATIGVDRSMSPHAALNDLVAWYRDFEARPFPDDLRGRDLFESVSTEKVGVCRHRSLAFMVAARSMGIPTRYIYNEAHAFVEVHWPGQGWRRIDLGGAANDFDFASRSGGSLHDASFNDNFPQPPNYVDELQRQADQQASSEDESESADESSTSPDASSAQAPSDRQDDPRANQGDSPSDQDDSAAIQDAPGDQQVESASEHLGEPPPDPDEASTSDQARPDERDQRQAVDLRITAATREAFRGREIRIEGRLRSASGRAISGQRVEIVLGPIGAGQNADLISLGTTTTTSDGSFEGRFSIPQSVSIGRWSVMARFRGNAEFRSAVAE